MILIISYYVSMRSGFPYESTSYWINKQFPLLVRLHIKRYILMFWNTHKVKATIFIMTLCDQSHGSVWLKKPALGWIYWFLVSGFP